jgi:hypothetical protein
MAWGIVEGSIDPDKVFNLGLVAGPDILRQAIPIF